MNFKDLIPAFLRKKPIPVRSTAFLVDNEHPELSAITAKVAELIAAEAMAKQAHLRSQEAIADFQKNLKATVDSHLADFEQLYGAKGVSSEK